MRKSLKDFAGSIGDLKIGDKILLCRKSYGEYQYTRSCEVESVTKTLVKFKDGTKEKKSELNFVFKNTETVTIVNRIASLRRIKSRLLTLTRSDVEKMSDKDLLQLDSILKRALDG